MKRSAVNAGATIEALTNARVKVMSKYLVILLFLAPHFKIPSAIGEAVYAERLPNASM
jgi:hypothetical protein